MIRKQHDTDYQRYLALVWLGNAMKRVHRRSDEAAALIAWIEEHILDLCEGLRAGDETALVEATKSIPVKRRGRAWRGMPDHSMMDSDEEEKATNSDKAWRNLRKHVERLASQAESVAPDLLSTRLGELAEIARLSPEDVAILELPLRYEVQPLLESLVDSITRARRFGPSGIGTTVASCFLDMNPKTIGRRLAFDAPLVASGLLNMDSDGDIDIPSRLKKIAWAPEKETDVRRLLLDASAPTELDWSDFDHVAHDRDRLEKILRGALQEGKKGVNILLYGPNGTGKTELSKVLANQIGATLFGGGEKDERGGAPSPSERLADLRLAGCLLGKDPNAILLFDEMDDLLGGGFPDLMPFGLILGGRRRSDGSKLFLNRLLEENAAPTIWTTNHAKSIDPAFLRRMTYVVHLRKPPPRVRERILTRQLERHKVRIEPAQVARLVRKFDMAPGVMEGAIRAAALVPEAEMLAMLERGIRNMAALMGGKRRVQSTPARFDPTFIQADQDLVKLADRLTRRGAKPLSLCLHGPPGTGKSAYVRFLAECMGLEVLHKRASDLLNKYVGESEQNIARAFEEALNTHSFLVFDEADSLLADRRGAHQNWELSLVNEMLTQMESHPLPFACTTNYTEKLDDATHRRFVFKVRFGYSSTEQAAGLFRRYFGMEAPAALASLKGLTPGDFAVVRHKAEITGQLDDADALVAMLRAECEAKPNLPGSIGFSPET